MSAPPARTGAGLGGRPLLARPAEVAAAQPRPGPKILAGPPRADFLAEAEALKPELVETVQAPISLVRAVPDAAQALRFRMEPEAPASALSSRVLRKGDSVIVDFGGHRTGYLSFRLDTQGRSPDSPARLRFVFGEVPTDVAEPLYPYTGQLSQAWLPDEIINVDDLPRAVAMPRRYAFRYVKIEVIDTSEGYGVLFRDLKAHAVTSARRAPAPLLSTVPATLRRIDEVSIATLRQRAAPSTEPVR